MQIVPTLDAVRNAVEPMHTGRMPNGSSCTTHALISASVNRTIIDDHRHINEVRPKTRLLR
jgi:hypothetical protein